MIEQQVYTIDHLKKYRIINGQEEVLIRWEGYQEQTWEPITGILNADQETIASIDAMREKYKEVKLRLGRKGIIIDDLQVVNPALKNAQGLQKRLQKKYFKRNPEESDLSFSGRRKKNKIQRKKVSKDGKQKQKLVNISKPLRVRQAKKRVIASNESLQSLKQNDPQIQPFRIRLKLNYQESQSQLSQISVFSEYFEEEKEKLPLALQCLKDLATNITKIKNSFVHKSETYYEVYFGFPEVKHPIILHQNHLTELCPSSFAEFLINKIK